METFHDLQLPAQILRGVEALSYSKPTPIQAQAIPHALKHRDLIGCAQTGTGKTAAFCIPILVRLLEKQDATALILAPTRELALQIETVWNGLSRFTPSVRAVTLIGGLSMQPQMRALSKRPRVIIATPGRLVDHLERRTANLSKTAILVLDEADRMLDIGFAPQLGRILNYLPRERQGLLFTATWDSRMDQLSKQYLKDPVRVTVGTPSQAAVTVKQATLETSVQKKNETLLDQLNARQGSILVFARTQSRTDRVARYLGTYGVDVGRIHGGRSQGQRKSALQAFRTGEIRVLVATDIAARGIDVAGVAHVINYDLPQAPEDYIHRIGRTGRAGATGEALSLLTPEDRSQWREITRLLKKSSSAVPN